MLGLTPRMNFYLCRGTTDMRKGIAILGELVRNNLHEKPDEGDVFSMSKNRRSVEILHHNTTGCVLYWKKLDRNRFLLPVFSSNTQHNESI